MAAPDLTAALLISFSIYGLYISRTEFEFGFSHVNICAIWTLEHNEAPKCDAKEEDPRDEESGELRSQVLHAVRVHRIHQKGTVDTLRLRSCIFHSSWRCQLIFHFLWISSFNNYVEETLILALYCLK